MMVSNTRFEAGQNSDGKGTTPEEGTLAPSSALPLPPLAQPTLHAY